MNKNEPEVNKNKDIAGVYGKVAEVLPNAMFRVELEDGRIILAYLAGKMRLHRIWVIVGDKVYLEVDKYGGRGRIVKRI